MSDFNMEDAAEAALNQWDNEHGSKDELSEEEERLRNEFLDETMHVEIIVNPNDPDGDRIGTVVDLPSNSNIADVMVVAILQTMAIRSDQTPEEVLMRLVRNMGKNLMQSEQIE